MTLDQRSPVVVSGETGVLYIVDIWRLDMRRLVSIFSRLAIAIVVSCLSVPASESGKTPAQKPEPLTRAVEEFKSLTRDWGIRPESPPSVQQHRGRKLRWHGRIYENFRNDVLDAIPHEVKQNGETKSPLRRNQFGFNVAGPVLIPHLINNADKTFFMLSYEGVRERISRASLHTVPTVPERVGDFSKTVDEAGNLLPIYDLETTAPNPSYDPTQPVSTSNLEYLRSPFPDNIIPSNRLAKNIQEVLPLYPLPNTNIGPFFQNNYFVNAAETDNADGIIAKLEHPLSSRQRLTSLSTISRGFLSAAKYFPNNASPTAPDQNFSSWRSELDYVFTASSRTVNSASLVVSSSVVQSGDSLQSAFPLYQLSNYLSMGTSYPSTRNARNSVEVFDVITAQRGKHSLNLTFAADHDQVNSFDSAYPAGNFQFSADITSLPGIIDTGYPFASFLLGLPAAGERTIITAPSYFRGSWQYISGADKYQLSKNLTLNASLLLSRRTPRVEKDDHQSTVDPAVIDPSNGLAGGLAFAGRDGISRGMRPANIDLDASAGVAWNPLGDVNTVVHASYARWHGPIAIYNGQWGTQGFNATQTFVSANTQLSPALDLTAGIPPYTMPLPDLSASAADGTVGDFADLKGLEPVYQSASLSVEREIPFSIMVSVGTAHSVGRNMLVSSTAIDPDAVNPSFLSYGSELYDEAFLQTLRPYPQYKGFSLYGLYPAGRYQRDSGYLQIEKRASFGLTFTAHYEYSKQFDNYSGPYGNQDLVNLHDDWALTYTNPPQYLQLSYIYELPFGAEKPLLHLQGWQGGLVNGWSVSGAAYWNDGTPLALHPEFNNTGGVLSALYVNVVPGVDRHVANQGPSEWFNPAAFDQPPDFTMGDGPKTLPDLMGPGYNSMDLSVYKRLYVGGQHALEFSATAFDLLNHANWNSPDTGIGPESAPNVNAGKIIGSHGGRVIQMGLKYSF